MLTRNQQLTLLAIGALCAGLAGCGGSSPEPGGAASETQPGDTPAAADASLTAAVEVLEGGPGPFDLTDPTAGLDALDSYRATLTLTFEGQESGQPSQWTQIVTLVASDDPPARLLTREGDLAGSLPAGQPAFEAQANGAAYRRSVDGVCIASALGSTRPLGSLDEPARFLLPVIGAEEAGTEDVNGVATRRYTFDEQALGDEGLADASGEVWVAADGGAVVRYTLTIQGGPDYFGEGVDGAMTWTYELAEVNQPVALDALADCPPGLIDAPLLPDASEVINEPGVIFYLTASSVAEAAAFYQEQLSAAGWQPTADPAMDETLAVLDFTRGDEQLTVTIRSGDGTQVQLVLTKTQPVE